MIFGFFSKVNQKAQALLSFPKDSQKQFSVAHGIMLLAMLPPLGVYLVLCADALKKAYEYPVHVAIMDAQISHSPLPNVANTFLACLLAAVPLALVEGAVLVSVAFTCSALSVAAEEIAGCLGLSRDAVKPGL